MLTDRRGSFGEKFKSLEFYVIWEKKCYHVWDTEAKWVHFAFCKMTSCKCKFICSKQKFCLKCSYFVTKAPE